MRMGRIVRFPAFGTLLALFSNLWNCAAAEGDGAIRAPYAGLEIVIRTSARTAGAIYSLTWNGREFIDAADHGRELQSACSFGRGTWKDFWAEAYNPTEAGSRRDGAGPASTSRLLSYRAASNELATAIQMAYWLRPGERSSGHPALNTNALSGHVVSKRVRIGVGAASNVIEYLATFSVPTNERATIAQFEALTGYMPAEFSAFWRFDREAQRLVALDDGPGEQADPVVLATPDGACAMGIWSPDQPSKGFEHAGYGRFRFPECRVVKWNCVFRYVDPAGIRPGDYTFRMFVVVGTRADVEQNMRASQRGAVLPP